MTRTRSIERSARCIRPSASSASNSLEAEAVGEAISTRMLFPWLRAVDCAAMSCRSSEPPPAWISITFSAPRKVVVGVASAGTVGVTVGSGTAGASIGAGTTGTADVAEYVGADGPPMKKNGTSITAKLATVMTEARAPSAMPAAAIAPPPSAPWERAMSRRARTPSTMAGIPVRMPKQKRPRIPHTREMAAFGSLGTGAAYG